MDSANRIISFVLGLVVVTVFLAVITGKFKLNSLAFLPFAAKTTITPTPTPTPKTTVISSVSVPSSKEENAIYQPYNQKTTNLKSIPNTGAPTILLPIAISSFLGGIFLKKKGK